MKQPWFSTDFLIYIHRITYACTNNDNSLNQKLIINTYNYVKHTAKPLENLKFIILNGGRVIIQFELLINPLKSYF